MREFGSLTAWVRGCGKWSAIWLVCEPSIGTTLLAIPPPLRHPVGTTLPTKPSPLRPSIGTTLPLTYPTSSMLRIPLADYQAAPASDPIM